MKIKNIFQKDLFRPINGVVKVGDESASTVWQELDEYVVTKELTSHFHKFFTTYLLGIDDPRSEEPRGKNGIWVSGFFGSGKSHFIKIISYLLGNDTVKDPKSGETKKAIDFFASKFDDQMFYGDVKRAVESPAEVILFNIDSKSGDSKSRDAILNVFMQVLNEHQGYCAAYPFLADVERQMDKDGTYETFKAAFETLQDSSWESERDAFALRRDNTVSAISGATGLSNEAANKLIDEAQSNYSLSVEKFVRLVKGYLDHKSKTHRVIFVADEVGQFGRSDQTDGTVAKYAFGPDDRAKGARIR